MFGKKWIDQVLKPNQFNLHIKTVFAPIMNMGLEWCKSIDDDAGWVSDNHLAFSMIIKWNYYPLIKIVYKDHLKSSDRKLCDVKVIHEVLGK